MQVNKEGEEKNVEESVKVGNKKTYFCKII